MGKADDTVDIVYFRREQKRIELEQDSIQYLHTKRKVLNKFPTHILSFQVEVFDPYQFKNQYWTRRANIDETLIDYLFRNDKHKQQKGRGK
jgi:hypothetical protein